MEANNMAALREFAEYVANYPTCKGCNGQTDSRFCDICLKEVALSPLALRARLALSKAKGDSDVLKTPVGNMAAMREALVKVKKSIDGIGASSLDCDPMILMASLTYVCARLSARIDAALSEPPRNCDVGTPEEHEERFKKFCGSHYNINNVDSECNGCPLNEEGSECEFAWGQMPYEAEKGGNK